MVGRQTGSNVDYGAVTVAVDVRVREREKSRLAIVPNFVPTTKPYCGLPIVPKLPRVQLSLDFGKACPIFVSLFVS
jgi:hypothetical protein